MPYLFQTPPEPNPLRFETTRGALTQPASPIGSTCIKRRRADSVTRTDDALTQPASRIGSTCIKLDDKTPTIHVATSGVYVVKERPSFA